MMRRRIAIIGSGEIARTVALVLLRRDDCDLTLVGETDADLRSAAGLLGVEPRVRSGSLDATTAAELLVLLEVGEKAAALLGVHCPDAVAYVASAQPVSDCARLQGVLRWPRSRLFGRPAGDAGPALVVAQIAQVVDHMLAERVAPVEVTALGRGPDEHAGWATVDAVLGNDGIRALRLQ